jgi:hypothetical protein
MTSNKWVRGIGALLGVLLWSPTLVFCDRECGCEDICEVQARLRERERLLEAAKQVEREALAGTFARASWYKRRFVQVAFPDGNYRVEGTQKHGQEIEVSEELKQSVCTGIWKATEAHELDHAEFDKTVPGWKYPWIMIFGQEGKFLARKEVSGYQAEVDYLKDELEKLKQGCPDTDCDPPQIERYQEANRVLREGQRVRQERSARRVGQYVQFIQ